MGRVGRQQPLARAMRMRETLFVPQECFRSRSGLVVILYMTNDLHVSVSIITNLSDLHQFCHQNCICGIQSASVLSDSKQCSLHTLNLAVSLESDSLLVGNHDSVAMVCSRLCSVVRTIESRLALAPVLVSACDDNADDVGDNVEDATAAKESADAGCDEDAKEECNDSVVLSRSACSFRKPRMRGSTMSSSSICPTGNQRERTKTKIDMLDSQKSRVSSARSGLHANTKTSP
jgi:hypothetical protein